MSGTQKILHVWKNVFGNLRHFILLLLVGFIFYLLNGFILNIKNIGSVFNLLGLFGMLRFMFFASLNFINNLDSFGAIGTILLSFMVGVLISLLVYRFNKVDKVSRRKIGFFGSLGVLFGVAAPGCAACGVGLLSVLGLGSALAVLPFHGKEILVIAIILVGFSVVNISRKLYNPVCELKLDDKRNERG